MHDARWDMLDKRLRKGQIKACIIKQDESLLLEYYRNRKTASSVHAINSCSKSITSMLIGICIRRGLIETLHTPIKTYFPEYFADKGDREKEKITLFHLLTMTSGIDWPEFGKWQFWTPMEFSQDIIKSALDNDLQCAPGTRMNYNSGSSNLLSAVIQRVSGEKTIDFAYRHLFAPLGISDIIWHEKQGISLGANGLKLKPADMLKLGELYLREGLCNGVQIVSGEWIAESIIPRFLTYADIGAYGYQWWVSDFESTPEERMPFYFALGLFGQYIIVVPACKAVVVFLSENYSNTMRPMRYFREYIAPGLL